MTDAALRPKPSLIEGSATALAVLATATVFGMLAYAGVEFTRGGGRVAALWLPNAFLVGILLRTRTNTCPYFVTAAFLANVGANLAAGDGSATALCLASANAVEIVLSILLMRRAYGRNPDIADLQVLTGMLGVAFVAPIVSGLVAMLGLYAADRLTLSAYASWVIADSLSLAIVTPLMLVAVDTWRRRRPATRSNLWVWFTLGILIVVPTTLIFTQEAYPFLFLVCPIVIIAAFRAGMAGTAVATSLVAVIASVATFLGHGPIMLVDGNATIQILVLQTFLAASFAMGLPVAAALSGREALRAKLADSQSFTTMMLNNIQEVIFRTDERGCWIFLNPAWTQLTGYEVADSLGWPTTKLLHPDDLVAARKIYPKIASGEIDQTLLTQRFFDAAGTCHFIEVMVRRLVDDKGAFIGTTGNIRDVSEAVQRERDLAESEARFRCMSEAAPVGIYRADASGQVTYVNRVWCEKTGLTFDESLGQGWMRALAEPEVFTDDPAFTGYHQTGSVRRRVLKFNSPGPHDLWVEAVNSAEFAEDGTLTGHIGVVIDVTEQRLAIEALKDSERKFQTLANLAPAGIFRTDGVGNCLYVNDAWLRLTGFEDDSWMNDGWASSVHPDDRERIFSAWRAAVADRRDFREEWRWVRKDGSISWVDGIGRPEVDENGRVSSFVGVNIDITERRMAEEKLAEREAQLELLATNATDAVFRIGLDGRCLYASPSVKRLTGIEPSEMVGRQMLARFHPDDCAIVTDAFLSLVSGAKAEQIITYRSEMRGTSGEYRWLEANCGVVRGTDCRPREVIASIRDVTHKKALEHDLRQARERAEQAASAKAAFLANMSHEIRTPMNGVLGFTELLASTALDPQQQHHVQLIADSGRAMMRLLNDILDISKIDSGQMQISCEAVDLRHKLNNCVRLMETVAVAKGLTLKMEVDGSVPAYVASDPLRVRQIALNLIGNAIKFTEAGGVDIRVTTDAAAPNPRLLIAVSDTGVGIPQDRLGTIFQQFAQADASIARRFGGTGLGLSISSELARLMGGSISVTSEVGKGSTFTVALPLKEAAGTPPDAMSIVDEQSTPVPAQRRARVLIAEDHDVNQMLMLSMATSANFDAEIAENGAEAIAMVEAAVRAGTPFDLVLMDMQMPVVDGLAATRELRAKGFSSTQLPIVALTANAYQDDIAACRAAGMQAHLSKPVRAREIREVVAKFTQATIPASVPTPAGLAAKPSARTLYMERRTQTLNAVAEAVRRGQVDEVSLAAIVDLLHKLAGTAGFFGEDGLGAAASELEDRLSCATEADAICILSAGIVSLSKAA